MQDLLDSMEHLRGLWADEERALAAHAGAAELAPIVRAKALATDRFVHAIEALLADDPCDRQALAALLRPFLDAAERNAAIVSRRMELVGGLLAAIERANADACFARLSRYEKSGTMCAEGRAPVAVDGVI